MKIKQSQRKTDAGHLTFNEDNESNKTTAYILLIQWHQWPSSTRKTDVKRGAPTPSPFNLSRILNDEQGVRVLYSSGHSATLALYHHLRRVPGLLQRPLDTNTAGRYL
ncbi:hypothetical protein OUZ56_013066 [Daphnia magna]|uniref:Uncharacterized protein n=1 Tax=Daphnia magna TaxID=35525 RepID=A0ABQ9Z4S5_9CRUS|nr:hypothetical protein OUZ56_013066 [Daphnia magna]